MKKKIIYLSIMFLAIISGMLIFKNNNKYNNYVQIDGYPNLNIKVFHNGEYINYFPIKHNYLYYNVDVACDYADAKWDYENWRLLVSNLTKPSICNINFISSAKKTLYNKIIADYNEGNNNKNIYKEDHTLESGSTYSEYRYEGNDLEVENYVWFNNELWRIIGAFPGGTPSTMSGTTFVQGNAAPSVNNTVKIIRNEAIGSFAWDKDNTNNWATAELNTNILNNLYLNSGTGTCDFYSTYTTKPCSFSENGLKNVQDYIEDATWNLGGWNSTSAYTTDMYNYERGTTICSGCSYPLLTTAKVGLMYPSDYGYASASDSCQTGTNLDSYGSCGKDGWLLKYGNEWTQSLYSGDTNFVFRPGSTAYLYYSYPGIGLSARPVVYLKSNVYVTGGDGSINNPYQVKLEDPSNANRPVLADGMIPIKHDGSAWVKASANGAYNEWYDYGNKEWANAVMVSSATRDTYMAADVGTTVAEADILAYYVWIPRYKYQLFNTEFADVDSQLINVEFENGISSTGTVTCSTSEIGVETCENAENGNWYTHPAFTFGNDELAGIWVGKFETSYGTTTSNSNPGNIVYTTPTIKPSVTSLRNQQVSNQFQTAQYFGTSSYLTSTGVNEVDAHMMKNIEWGAVAYLKQSSYGLGTTDIKLNANTYYRTGCGPRSSTSTSTTNTCNAYTSTLGKSASTTGNVTGVYDMSGGAHENIMGVIQDDTTTNRSPMSGASTTKNSGYLGKISDYTDSGNTLVFPNAKYYNLYANVTSSSDYTKSHLGDATGETSSWFSDSVVFAYADKPWFSRGGYISSAASAGVFFFNGNDGANSTSNGFRSVLSPKK